MTRFSIEDEFLLFSYTIRCLETVELFIVDLVVYFDLFFKCKISNDKKKRKQIKNSKFYPFLKKKALYVCKL